MTADRWTQAVQRQLGLGRLLPLGHPRDGAWIAEEAADAFLRRAAAGVPGIRLGALRIALADPDLVDDPVVPPPPSALPPGPLRVVAEFTAEADPTAPGVEPLPTTAARLRATLAEAAEPLGLTVTEVDLKVTGLGDVSAPPSAVRHVAPRPAAVPTAPDEARAATAALSVPGVLHLTDVLGRPVHIEHVPGEDPALARRHVRVELAVAATERTVDVARAVRTAVADALPDTPSVAALVTAVE
ncbi:nucleopolyhedrovirus P10 family protein [Streptomyces sp. NBC_01340]|uniref:nucleopolyhedrovirus P10 family protein n=1 Tax=unclassified Streptomyces TaxID=2593676 RepID=UPI002256C1F5|nr:MULTISPECIES: nucleopolyhedrovirus P10 family protein [unclassified Streptomyces]MCX4453210.1 nucleopolyhedrovirus P10 family protein [Streptomyces sp. NBC_01719]MCX4492570.1 nucleopolyhedrovirus P10 family protein [Streptomyces sp. NBC_01728]WSI37727.1 nucleopolyhedrovirus P10 family protein [Streptomyces sp. NBC_01340]